MYIVQPRSKLALALEVLVMTYALILWYPFCLSTWITIYKSVALRHGVIRLIKVFSSTLHKQANDQTEKTKDRTEDLNDEDLNEAADLLDRLHSSSRTVRTVRDQLHQPRPRYFR